MALDAIAQEKIYNLVDKTTNADIDLKRLSHINDYGAGYKKLDKVFRPDKGKFTVYRFIATFKGLSHEMEKQETFHDLIILKADEKNFIKEAYQYTLEWAEMPCTIDLYFMKAKNIKLTNGMDVQKLQFTNSERKYALRENGILKTE